MQVFQRYRERHYRRQLLMRAHNAKRTWKALKANKIEKALEQVQQAIPATEETQSRFQATYGEAMPDHLHHAIKQELNSWHILHNHLETIARQGDYATFAKERWRLMTHAETLQKLISIEEEILTSPLTKTFLEKLTALKNNWG